MQTYKKSEAQSDIESAATTKYWQMIPNYLLKKLMLRMQVSLQV